MEPTGIAAQLSANPLLALPALFAAGVLTSLTPCIYPMIPIAAAIVGGQQVGVASRPRRRTVLLTLSYVIGLALAYATVGLIAGLTGTLFGAVSTNPWLYFLMANLLLVGALMMLDVIPVPIPRRTLEWATTAGNNAGLGGTFVMGAASGLVAAPCSAPVMAAVLTWITTTRSAPLGFIYLFTFSLGMCTLLVLIGLFSGTVARLPRSGQWMLWVKRGFAVILIGAAEYYMVQMGKLLI